MIVRENIEHKDLIDIYKKLDKAQNWGTMYQILKMDEVIGGNWQSYYNIGIFLIDSGIYIPLKKYQYIPFGVKYHTCIRYLKKAAKLSRNNIHVLHALYYAYYKSEKYHESLKVALVISDKNNSNYAKWMLCASLYKLKKYSECVKILEKILKTVSNTEIKEAVRLAIASSRLLGGMPLNSDLINIMVEFSKIESIYYNELYLKECATEIIKCVKEHHYNPKKILEIHHPFNFHDLWTNQINFI